MAKKRRGRKMPAWRKWAKAAVGILGKGLGITAAAGPAIVAIKGNISNPEAIPGNVLYQYTGVNVFAGTMDWKQAFVGVASVVGGIVLMSLFSAVARRV